MMDISELRVSLRMWIIFTVLFFFKLPGAECYFELSASDHEVCAAGTNKNSTVDLVCRVQEHMLSRGTSCTVEDIKWFKTTGVSTFEISTSSKYTIWESVRGGGASSQQRVALLRLSQFQISDVARYSCHVTCNYGSGLNSVIRLHSDVCLQDPDLRGLQCPVLIRQDSCAYNFRNGRCDGICNVRDHLYDGHDCAVETPECADPQCARRYSDGVCNQQCNTAECQWDGGDCINTALDLARDSILVKVERVYSSDYHQSAVEPTHRQLNYRTLARYLTRETHSLLRIVPVPRRERTLTSEPASLDISGTVPYQYTDSQKAFDNVVLKLDNTQCDNVCLKSVHQVAQYLHLLNIIDKASQDLNMKIHAITVLKDFPKPCSFKNTSLLHLDFTDSASSETLKTQDTAIDSPAESSSAEHSWSLSYWVIALCVVGTLIIVALLVAIFVVMVSIRREQQIRTKKDLKNQRIYSPFHKDKQLNTAVDV